MSVARVTTVNRSMKDGSCEKCGVALPKGSAYRWYKVGFRSKYKHVRCMDSKCTPRTSELESSRLSDAYAALEKAEDDLLALDPHGLEGVEEITDILMEASGAIQEVADEYSSAAQDMGGAGYEMEERADALSSLADDIGNTDIEEPEAEDCEECNGTGEVQRWSPSGQFLLGMMSCPAGCDDGKSDEPLDWTDAIDEALDVVRSAEMP